MRSWTLLVQSFLCFFSCVSSTQQANTIEQIMDDVFGPARTLDHVARRNNIRKDSGLPPGLPDLLEQIVDDMTNSKGPSIGLPRTVEVISSSPFMPPPFPGMGLSNVRPKVIEIIGPRQGPFLRPSMRGFPHMIMGGPIQFPRIATMEITMTGNGGTITSHFGSNRLMKVFGPHVIKRPPIHNPDENKLIRKVGSLIEQGIEAIGGEVTKEGIQFNQTALNNTINQVEKTIEEGVHKFENYLNTTFEKDLDNVFGNFFGDDSKKLKTQKKNQNKDAETSVIVKSITKHKDPVMIEINGQKQQKSIKTSDRKTTIPKNEIEREIKKTIQINGNKSEKEIDKEVAKMMDDKTAGQSLSSTSNSKSTSSSSSSSTSAYKSPDVSQSNYISLGFFSFQILFGLFIFISVGIFACLIFCKNQKETNSSSSTEKKFLENMTFKETDSNKFY